MLKNKTKSETIRKRRTAVQGIALLLQVIAFTLGACVLTFDPMVSDSLSDSLKFCALFLSIMVALLITAYVMKNPVSLLGTIVSAYVVCLCFLYKHFKVFRRFHPFQVSNKLMRGSGGTYWLTFSNCKQLYRMYRYNMDMDR